MIKIETKTRTSFFYLKAWVVSQEAQCYSLSQTSPDSEKLSRLNAMVWDALKLFDLCTHTQEIFVNIFKRNNTFYQFRMKVRIYLSLFKL